MPELRFSTPPLAHEIALDPEIGLSLCNNSRRRRGIDVGEVLR
jgi:hypothetical protein